MASVYLLGATPHRFVFPYETVARLESLFDAYVERFRTEGDAGAPIEMKIEHSRAVRLEMTGICESLGLKDDSRTVPEVVALLHDIGRFEQYHRYRTYVDSKSEDHGTLGVSVLHREGLLTNLPPELRRRIMTAIAAHNKRTIHAGVKGATRKLAMMIRDADKLDIMRIALWSYQQKGHASKAAVELGLPDTPGFNEELIEDARKSHAAQFSSVRNLNDFKILQMGWVRDLNFPWTCRQYLERGYLHSLRQLLPASPQIDDLYAALTAHLTAKAVSARDTTTRTRRKAPGNAA